MKANYGWTYNKAGQLVQVSAPVNAKGKIMPKHKKTQTGALHSSVGFSASK